MTNCKQIHRGVGTSLIWKSIQQRERKWIGNIAVTLLIRLALADDAELGEHAFGNKFHVFMEIPSTVYFSCIHGSITEELTSRKSLDMVVEHLEYRVEVKLEVSMRTHSRNP